MCKIKQERLLKLNEYLKGLKVSKWDTKTVTNRRYRTTARSLLGLLAKIIIKIKNCYLLKDICWGWLFQRTPSAHLPVPGLESHLYFQSYLPANVHPAKVQVIPAGVLEAPSHWRPRLNSKPGTGSAQVPRHCREWTNRRTVCGLWLSAFETNQKR